ncbi:helix-turn-helix domain-containing protein [Cohnella cellulosilytica]|uniref:Helix-turn-helix domain-containing protein n=1 Tax=Cohnella cellulosilytica TaxID=986710 RepID=A0ABW2F6F0_9BACL
MGLGWGNLGSGWISGLAARKKRSRSFYWKSLVLLLTVTSIPGLVTGGIIYWTSTKQIATELRQLHVNRIQQRAENIGDQFSYLEMLFSRWSFDTQFDNKLLKLDFVYNYEQIHDIYRTLLIMEGSHPLVSGVELYLDRPEPRVFRKDIYLNLDASEADNRYAPWLEHAKYEFWTDEFQSYNGKTWSSPGMTLVSKVPGGGVESFGYIAAVINYDWLNRLLNTLTPYEGGTTVLLGGTDYRFLNGEGRAGPLERALREAYLGREDRESSFLFAYEGADYLVFTGTFSRLGSDWTYVSAAPVSAITAPLLFASRLMLWISGCGLVLALLLSWGASLRLYSPIGRLMGILSKDSAYARASSDNRDEFELIERQWRHLTSEREELTNRLEAHVPQMRESFLLQVVQGRLFSRNEPELRERLRQYGWEAEGKQLVVVVVQLTRFSQLEGRFSPGDEDLVTFAAVNIVSELLEAQALPFQTLNFHDLTLGLLLAFPGELAEKELRGELNRLSGEWIAAVEKVLKLQMTVSASRPSPQVRQLPMLFEEARRVQNYEDVRGGSQIIHAGDEEKRRSAEGEFRYPFALEKEIIHAVRIGSEEEASELIERFLETLSESGAKLVVQQGMLQLLGSLQHAMLHSGANPIRLFGGGNLYEQLAACVNPEGIPQWFRQKVVGPYVKELIDRQDYHMKQMVEKTLLLIGDGYMSFELSLERCADQFGTSAYTLSRAFKQITGITFIDYLTHLRLEKAKTALRETDGKINDIAIGVGYQHTYFNRIFKKYEGITPSQYREMNRGG